MRSAGTSPHGFGPSESSEISHRCLGNDQALRSRLSCIAAGASEPTPRMGAGTLSWRVDPS
eukprot:4950327-Heterocapsa_arctica.AAC.1